VREREVDVALHAAVRVAPALAHVVQVDRIVDDARVRVERARAPHPRAGRPGARDPDRLGLADAPFEVAVAGEDVDVGAIERARVRLEGASVERSDAGRPARVGQEPHYLGHARRAAVAIRHRQMLVDDDDGAQAIRRARRKGAHQCTESIAAAADQFAGAVGAHDRVETLHRRDGARECVHRRDAGRVRGAARRILPARVE